MHTCAKTKLYHNNNKKLTIDSYAQAKLLSDSHLLIALIHPSQTKPLGSFCGLRQIFAPFTYKNRNIHFKRNNSEPTYFYASFMLAF